MQKEEIDKKIEEIKQNTEKKVMREQIKLLEENIEIVKKQYLDKTGESYDKVEEFTMDKVLKRIYGKSKTGTVSNKEFRTIAKEHGYDIRGASALFKKYLVKLAWNRVGLTPEGQMYVESLTD